MTNSHKKYKKSNIRRKKKLKLNKQSKYYTKKLRKLTRRINKLNGGKMSKKYRLNGGDNDTYMDFLIKNYNTASEAMKLKNNNKHFIPLTEGRKIFTFADIHGDLELLERLLKIGKIITFKNSNIKLPKTNNEGIRDVIKMQEYFDNLRWNAGSNYVVQIGDQIDRSRDTDNHTSLDDEGSTFEIVYYLYKLNELAKEANKNTGNVSSNYVFSLLGNHEIMNVQGDMNYVSKAEKRVFRERLRDLFDKTNNKSSNNEKESLRAFFYKPGNLMSNFMAAHYYSILQIGPYLFVHGGITEELFNTNDSFNTNNLSLSFINNLVSNYLFGKVDQNNERLRSLINENNSLLWNRDLGQESHSDISDNNSNNSIKKKDELLKKLQKILDRYKQNNSSLIKPRIMCIGHTPQYFHDESANLLFCKSRQELGQESGQESEQNIGKNNKRLIIRSFDLTKTKNPDVVRLDTGASKAFGVKFKNIRKAVVAELDSSASIIKLLELNKGNSNN